MLSGAMRMAEKGRLFIVRARRWTTRQASIPALIWSVVGLGGQGGKMECEAMVMSSTKKLLTRIKQHWNMATTTFTMLTEGAELRCCRKINSQPF